MQPLTREDLAAGVVQLAGRDPDLAALYGRVGVPPLWARPHGFGTLVHIILEQQVSLASARAAYERLLVVAAPLTPARFLTLDDAQLRAIGFSRQKSGYARSLAQAIVNGELDLDALPHMADDPARNHLLARKGIGPWSAEIYLLMALGRADAWPAGDLALAIAAQEVKGLASRPDPVALTALAEPWRPLRAVAARLLWQHYLTTPRRSRAAAPHMPQEDPPA